MGDLKSHYLDSYGAPVLLGGDAEAELVAKARADNPGSRPAVLGVAEVPEDHPDYAVGTGTYNRVAELAIPSDDEPEHRALYGRLLDGRWVLWAN